MHERREKNFNSWLKFFDPGSILKLGEINIFYVKKNKKELNFLVGIEPTSFNIRETRRVCKNYELIKLRESNNWLVILLNFNESLI